MGFDLSGLTVVSDETGETVPVTPVEAVATIVIQSTMSRDMPDDAASRIEQAMVAAIQNAHAAGIFDSEEVKALMMSARDSVHIAMQNEMRDLRSQQAAGRV